MKGLKISLDENSDQEYIEEFCQNITEQTDGFTGADLKGLIYNAQLNSIHRALKQAQISK